MTTPTSLRSHAQLLADGVSRRELAQALRARSLEKVRRGTYAEPHDGPDAARHARLVRATLPHLHPDAVVSHLSAAVLHGMPLERRRLGPVVVTRAGGVHGRRSSTLHVRVGRLPDADVTVVDGVRVTTLARTASDLARELSHEWGVIGCDHVLHAGVGREELEQQVEAARGVRGCGRLRAAVAFADDRSESPIESVSRVQFARLGLPMPELQFRVALGGRVVARCDFGWPEHGLVGEADGKVKYGDLVRPGEKASDVVMAEKRREERIRQAGFWIVRWGWDEAWNPAVLEKLVRTALGHAR